MKKPATPKKRINSKNKGGSFERLIAKQLSLWFSKNQSDSIFWRTASSGGRATQRTKRGQSVTNSAGDLSFSDSTGEPFLKCCAVELKSGYNSATLNKLFSSTKPELLSFFTQALESATQAQVPYWLVIHKQDRQSTMLYCNAELLSAYRDATTRLSGEVPLYHDFDFSSFPSPIILTSVQIGNSPVKVVGMRFDDFLTLDPSLFRPEILFPSPKTASY